MEEKKNWGKKLTGGLICAGIIYQIVQIEPKMALWGIVGIMQIALTYMVLQYLSDKKKG